CALRIITRDKWRTQRTCWRSTASYVVSGRLREVIDDDRQRRAVAYEAVERQHVRWVRHLSLVIMRSAHHGDVVAEIGRVFRQAQGFDGRLDSSAGDQHLFVGGRIARALQHLATLVIAKQNRLAGRALHHDASYRPARVLLDVLLQLAEVDLAVRIKRRSDGRKDSV